MKILGISCFYHDSAASIVVNNEIIAAVQERDLQEKSIHQNFLSIQLSIVLKNQG